MAVDARLVRSASRPLSNKKLDELREERKKLEERGEQSKAVKLQRDLESDWTVRDGNAIFGMKEHASIDVESGLVLSTLISKASEHDTNYFQAVVIRGIHGEKLPWKLYADRGTAVRQTANS